MTDDFAPSSSPTPPPVPPSAPRPQGRGLLWLILALQVVILAWLAKNHFDGTSHRRGSFPSSPAAPAAAIPPSLECARDVPSPSPLDDEVDESDEAARPATPLPPPAAYRDPFAIFHRAPRHAAFPASRWHADVQRMMDEAWEAHEAMLQDFGSYFSPGPEWASLTASPAVNMRELDDAYELTLAQPGLAPDDLDVRLDGRTLTLRYDRRTDTSSPGGARQTGHQSGSVRMGLPGPVAPGAVPEISNDNNRIRIRIAKPEPSQGVPTP